MLSLKEYRKIFAEYGLPYGLKEISQSKPDYLRKNKNHIVIFNACVLSKDGYVWHGDIDLTENSERLDTISNSLGMELVVENESFREIYSTTDKFIGLEAKYVKKLNGRYYKI